MAEAQVIRSAAIELDALTAFLAIARDEGDLVWLDSAIGAPGRGARSVLCIELEPVVVGAADGSIRWGDERTTNDPSPNGENPDGENRNGENPDGHATTRPADALWRMADAAHAADAEAHAHSAALGWVGYISYEAGSLADDAIPDGAGRLAFPLLRFDRVRAALVWADDAATLVVSGATPDAADARLLRCQRRLAAAGTAKPPEVAPLTPRALPVGERHRAHVSDVRREIAAGNVYQACYTFPLHFQRPPSLAGAYAKLRATSPGDFGAYVRLGPLEAASTSPERLLQLSGRRASCRPMKGTVPRRADPLEDAAAAAALRASAKDRAENVMIVDLVRNDLGRVCELGSVHVPALYEVESYATVHQLTSTVEGTLSDGVGPFQALRAVFPPGSMTGAPKVAACRLLRTLEGEPRGLYAGSIAWVGYDGNAEFNVVIRTLQAWGDTLRWDVGGGVVWDSTPHGEFAEALTKSDALHAAGLLSERIAERVDESERIAERVDDR